MVLILFFVNALNISGFLLWLLYLILNLTHNYRQIQSDITGEPRLPLVRLCDLLWQFLHKALSSFNTCTKWTYRDEELVLPPPKKQTKKNISGTPLWTIFQHYGDQQLHFIQRAMCHPPWQAHGQDTTFRNFWLLSSQGDHLPVPLWHSGHIVEGKYGSVLL